MELRMKNFNIMGGGGGSGEWAVGAGGGLRPQCTLCLQTQTV